MTIFYARLQSVKDVKDFVAAATLCPADIDVVSGRYTVDAKSLLGICSLDLDRPVLVKVYGDDQDGADFRARIGQMVQE